MTNWQNLNIVRVNTSEAKVGKNGQTIVRGTLVNSSTKEYTNFTASGKSADAALALQPGDYVSVLLSETDRPLTANGSREMYAQGFRLIFRKAAKVAA